MMTELEYLVDRVLEESKREAAAATKREHAGGMEHNVRRDRAEAFLRCLDRLGYRIVPR
jgi:hypothetical protein